MRQHQYGLSSKNEYLMFRLKLDILRKITVKGLNLKFTENKYVSIKVLEEKLFFFLTNTLNYIKIILYSSSSLNNFDEHE
jgi:hypothetical protein